MPVLSWSDDYSVNIKEIDEQHKKFIQLVNNFYDSLQDNIDHEAMPYLLNELVDYTKIHFSTEERLMKKHQYPEYETHKAEHDNFTKEALEILKKYEDGDKSAVDKLPLLLNGWLADHIVMKDKEYGKYINGKGAS